MKKIIDFILKELNILFTDYQTKTLHDSFFVFLFQGRCYVRLHRRWPTTLLRLSTMQTNTLR